MSLLDKIIGTHSERELKRIAPIVDKIESLRPAMQALTDEELATLKDILNGEVEDDIDESQML